MKYVTKKYLRKSRTGVEQLNLQTREREQGGRGHGGSVFCVNPRGTLSTPVPRDIKATFSCTSISGYHSRSCLLLFFSKPVSSALFFFFNDFVGFCHSSVK